jgi:hypothetical protein
MSQTHQAADPVLDKIMRRLVKISLGTAIVIGALYVGFWAYDTYISIEKQGVAETLLR